MKKYKGYYSGSGKTNRRGYSRKNSAYGSTPMPTSAKLLIALLCIAALIVGFFIMRVILNLIYVWL